MNKRTACILLVILLALSALCPAAGEVTAPRQAATALLSARMEQHGASSLQSYLDSLFTLDDPDPYAADLFPILMLYSAPDGGKYLAGVQEYLCTR